MKSIASSTAKAELLIADAVYSPMIRRTYLSVLGLLALFAWNAAQAATIHKWVDDKGVTHYSDEMPADADSNVSQLDIDTGEDLQTQPSTHGDDYYSIANQWQRMNQERLQRDQLELQRAALRAERANPVEPAVEYRDSRDTRYVVGYPRRHHRRHRPRPQPYAHSGSSQLPANHSPGAFPSIVKP